MNYSNCPLFKGLSEKDIKKLSECLKVKQQTFESDEEICSYNYDKNVLGFILSGKAYIKKLDRNGNYTILETLFKNSVFSDFFAYTATDTNYISVVASEKTTVTFIEFDCIFKRCSKACSYHSTFVINLMELIVAKSKSLSQRVEILSNKTIRDKILSYVSLMVDNLNSKNFTLPMSYTTLAEYLCVDRSAMMREIKKLKESGIISVNKKEITVLSSEI
jgi:CRP-like cAMP-binding protein